MSTVGRFRRDDRQPLVDRLRAGLRVQVVASLLVGGGVLMVTEPAARWFERSIDTIELAEAQRLDLARLDAAVSALKLAPAFAEQAERREDVDDLVDQVRERAYLMEVHLPSVADAPVMIDSPTAGLIESTVTDATHRLADFAACHADVVGQASGRSCRLPAPGEFEDLLVAVDDVLEQRVSAQTANERDQVGWLRTGGRIVAVLGVVSAVIRNVAVGVPFVRRVETEQSALQRSLHAYEVDNRRRDLRRRLSDGLEAVDDETGVHRVVGRTLSEVVDRPAELLLADSSKAHLRLVASHEHHGTAGCSVRSPWSCPAVRRGTPVVYDDSEAIRACPYLIDRPGGDVSAACVPVSFMGDAMGVIHVVDEPGEPPDKDQVESLGAVAAEVAMRLGGIRSFAKAQLQATVDVLTGLPNRRATEEHIAGLLRRQEAGALAMGDLDRFKRLNDAYGHDAGDRALRLFAEIVRSVVRDGDWVGRWGGEEFVLFFPGLTAEQATGVLDRIRERLARHLAGSADPGFTLSFGVVDTGLGWSLETLVSEADAYLYLAKDRGRDRVVSHRTHAPEPAESIETGEGRS